MAQGGLARLSIARLKSAGVPVAPLLKRAGLTPAVIADPEERLSVRSQVALLEEVAIALKDDCLGFTLARDFDPREIGLLYYVMASSQTLGDGLKRIARYCQITNEAVVVRYQEGKAHYRSREQILVTPRCCAGPSRPTYRWNSRPSLNWRSISKPPKRSV